MLKAKTGNTIILGLSDMNIEKLKNNEPILFNLKAAGLSDEDLDIMIFNGRTEESMLESIKENIGPSTKIKMNDEINYKIGNYIFNQDSRILKLDNVTERKLTNKEAHLLKMLCMSGRNNEVLDRNLALSEIWQDVNYYNSRSMDVYITKLRSYLKQDSRVGIENIHGKGFKLHIKTD